MGLFDRLSRLVKSNVNSALDKAEDPGKKVDQMIADMESAVKDTRKAVIDALAAEKLSRGRAETLAKTAAEWNERAARAVRAGDDDLAKQALERESEVSSEVHSARLAAEEAGAYVTKLKAALDGVEKRLAEVKGNREVIKQRARAQAGKSALGDVPGLKQFDDAVARIDASEAEAEIDEELRAMTHEDQKSKEAERRLDALSKESAVDEQLAALKAKMNK